VTRAIRLGISPCPNDTFTFHALLEHEIATPDLDLAIELHDIEELNERFEHGALDASKTSYAAALAWSERCVVLSSGSALGFGVGPLLLARASAPRLQDGIIPTGARVLIPGERTTAHLLYRLFHSSRGRIEHVRFSEILPALERGDADYGVCIHEARFTWRDRGLELVEDLGRSWERTTRAPLPLGGVVARADLGRDVCVQLDRAVRRSLAHARQHPDAALATMRAHAQELDDAVLWRHVEAYVNAWTVDLGTEGCRALETLAAAARSIGWIDAATRPLAVLDAGR
jgi:1,4-dihydroxy-6-naphthoate synthase